ncbi:ThiF family adenylyltransferase [Streptomyces rubiginosohelvolus]|uniref:ThiF family adenylyltransferase n=1 Tax=Streptomyces rubiginosohelvolus TaxID=67362 RepID=UPI00369DF230
MHVWGCGGLGSWIPEFVVRAGTSQATVSDPGTVSCGLLVRQNYVEADVGSSKAQAMARAAASNQRHRGDPRPRRHTARCCCSGGCRSHYRRDRQLRYGAHSGAPRSYRGAPGPGSGSHRHPHRRPGPAERLRVYHPAGAQQHRHCRWEDRTGRPRPGAVPPTVAGHPIMWLSMNLV